MDMEAKLETLRMQATLSTLWLVTLLNVVFRDIHEFLRPGYLEDVMARTAAGAGLPEIAFLGFAVVLEIPILMVLLARVLPLRWNTWANLIAAPLMMLFVASGLYIDRPADLDDLFHASVELVLLLVVLRLAWRWRDRTRVRAPSASPEAT